MPVPDMVPLVSSNLEGVAYDQEDQTLYVWFKGSGNREPSCYQYYPNVPVDIYEGLLAAESAGKYLNQNVKGTFSYRKIS